MNTINQASVEKRRASRRKYEQNTDLPTLTVRVHKNRRENVYIYAMTDMCPSCMFTLQSLKHSNNETRDLKEVIHSYQIEIQNLQSWSEMKLKQQNRVYFFVLCLLMIPILIK